MSDSPTKIRITATPPGEAPDWVREKWVGLELPVAGSPRPRWTTGVTSNPSFFASLWRLFSGRSERKVGYAVDARSAVDILERSSPEAAAWWRQNTPQLLAHDHRFLFQAAVCEVVS